MSYRFCKDPDPEEIRAFVEESDQNTLLQCPEWAKVKANWSHVFTCVKDGDRLIASALVLIRRLPLGLSVCYVPRGPVMDYHNEELAGFYLDNLKALARREKAIMLKFDPAVLRRRYAYKNRRDPGSYENQDIVEWLKQYGAKHNGYTEDMALDVQPRFIGVSDVYQGYRNDLDKRVKQRLHAAGKRGVQLYEGAQYLDDFAEVMAATEARKQVALRNKEYYAKLLEVYGEKAVCMVAKLNFPRQIAVTEDDISSIKTKLAGEKLTKKETATLEQKLVSEEKELAKLKEDYQSEGKDEVVLAGQLFVSNGRLTEKLYMGNNPAYMRLYASYMLYAACFDRCLELNIKRCCLGGIEAAGDDGLTLFKSHWLMSVEEYIGEFDIVLNPLLYRAFTDVYPALRRAAGKKKRK